MRGRRRAERKARSARHPWGAWHPVASSFHAATRDAPWVSEVDADAVEAAQIRFSPHHTPPGPFKPTRGRGIQLPVRSTDGEFVDVLLDRRTWRGFGRKSLAADRLGTLLGLTFGAMMTGNTRDGGTVMFRTSPSAGATHPIEAYVLAVNIAGLSRGLYHYSPEKDRLYLIKRGASPAQLVRYVSGQWWYRDAAALVLMTAVLPRVRTRYPHPRAYRSVLLDAGHICQTFCLVATWLALAPFCTQALADSLIERDLGINGVEEVLLYSAGVGTRPPDGKWVQWPPHDPAHPYLQPRAARTR